MKVKQRLKISVFVSAVTTLIIVGVLTLSLYNINRANNIAKVAGDLILSSFERLTLRNDYLRNNNDRARGQWFAKHREIGKILKAASETFRDPEDREIIARLLKGHASIGRLFSGIVDSRNRRESHRESQVLSQETEARLLNQLNMRVYETSADVRKLLESSREARSSALRRAGGSIVFVLVVMVATALFNSWTASRTIADRIGRLHTGASVIGRGDLDYRIDMGGNDEFAELSDAFNAMTAQLRGSRRDLEAEIEENRQTQEALAQSEARLRRFYESGLIGMIYWNMDGIITDANDRFLDMVGYTREELNSRAIDWIGMTPPEYRHLDERSLAELRAVGANETPYEKEYIRKDGTRIPILISGAMLDDARFNGVAFVLDITDRKRAEEKLEKAYGELEERVTERTKELRDAEKKLREMNEILEQRVEARTADLQAANAALQNSRLASLNLMEDAVAARKQAEKTSELVKALIAIGNIIHSTFDFDEIMEQALNEAGKALRCNTAAVSLRRQNLWVVSHHYGFSDDVVGSVMSDEQEPHALLAVTTKQPVAINDAYADERVNRDHMKAYGIRAVIAVPLIIGNDAVGVLFLNYHDSPVQFSQAQIDFAGQLGMSLSLALQNSRLLDNYRQSEESLLQANRRLAVLSETAGVLLASENPQQVVNNLCRKVMEHLDCHAFFNFLVDEGAGRLRLNAFAGIPDQVARQIEWLDYGVAVCGCAARDNCRIVAEHIPSTPDERTELVKSYGIKAYACHPLLGPGGRVIGTLSFGTRTRETFSDDDLSLMKAVADHVAVAMNRMNAERNLRQRGEALQAANRDLESFIYSVSHDLRTPMRSMAVFTKLIAESCADRLDAREKDYFRRVTEAGVRMNRLVEDLLYLSRVSRQEIKRIRFDLSGMASRIVSDLREASPGRKVSVDIDRDLSVFADPQLTQLVLLNLLGNAWKFTSKNDNAHIAFGKRERDDVIEYYVSDNGAGFDPEYAAKMFHPFQRLHSDDEFEGTGIGLAIVEQAIRRHGGQVRAHGEVGKGATVFFTLA